MFLLTIITNGNAQNYIPSDFLKIVPKINKSTPEWAIKMYSDNPNVEEIDRLYRMYYKTNPFQKTIHTQNYKHWRWQVEPYIGDNGFLRLPTRAEQDVRSLEVKNRFNRRMSTPRSSSPWYAMGPFMTYSQSSNTVSKNHKNIYSIDQSASNPNLLICGTEAGGIYKTIDKGQNWTLITKGEAFVGGNTAVKIHPTNANNFFVSSNKRIYRSLDGGSTWTEVHYTNGSMVEFKFDPSNSSNIFAVGSTGLFKSTDGGATWSQVYSDYCYDLDFHPTNSSIVYLLKKNSTAKRSELFRSDDGGATWTLKDNGYYSPSDLNEASVGGGKIAVSPASPDWVYVCLIDKGKASDSGWIGVYKSTDKGDNWTNPSGQDGAPYGSINGSGVWNVSAYSSGYHQGFYNFDFEVSDINASKLWVATIRLAESTDGGATWTSIGSANSQRHSDVHADVQDIDVNGSEIWVATDGGIGYSNDELATHTILIKGIQASHFWGFETGWNEDVFVGGKYHVGTSAYYEGYNLGDAQHIGGVEEPTGYVNPINSRKVYYRTHYNSSNTSVKTISKTIGGTTLSHASLPLHPNESYSTSRSSGLYFDPRYADHLFMGRDNFIYKSTNGGASFDALYTFPAGKVYEVEISRKNPDVIYAVFQADNGNTYWNACTIYKTTDGGTTWSQVTTPPSNSTRRLEISIHPDNENEVWVATSGNNSNKVFKTTDGGTTWSNMTGSNGTLDNEDTRDIFYQGGTNDVVYLATRTTVFYWDAATSDWIEYGNGLPAIAKSIKLKPFYRDAELRLGTGGRGAFGREMAHTNFTPLAQPITYKENIYCGKDTVKFDCYSILKHAGASWQWSFSPAPAYVSSLTARNPVVVFGANGNYDVTLTVTDGNGATHSKTVTNMIKIDDRCATNNLAGKALKVNGSSSDYLQTGEFNVSTNNLTISTWIKRNGNQNDWAGLVFQVGTSSSLGLNFGTNNELRYHWSSSSHWGWNSGAVVPNNEWTHVVLVIEPTKATIYLNGEAHVNNVSHSEKMLDGDFRFGVMEGHSSRNFNGEMDEVTIWNRALTKEEIRAMRHLTKTDAMLASDDKLIGYFQFDEEVNNEVFNKAGRTHGILKGNATLVNSTAPIGGGIVEEQTLSGAGVYDFSTVGAKLTFDNCTSVDGKMYISKINNQPHLPPNANPHAGNYWIINHYDETVGFSPLPQIELTATDAAFTTGLGSASDAYLHVRSENSDAFVWTTNASAKSKTGNTLTFEKSNKISGVTQVFLTNSGTAFTETDAVSYCEPDTLPLKALSLPSTSGSDNVIIPPLNLNTNKMTISAWIKPDGIQNSGAGVVFSRDGTTAAGLNFTSNNNQLGYNWNATEWQWQSGAIVPVDEWSHVALVIEPHQATIYLNGKPYVRTGRNHPLQAFDGNTLIGKNDGLSSRRFKGEIDEVVIWNRALHMSEIRRHRHLTKEKMVGNMPSLKAYYQFNEAEGNTVYDKSGNNNHASLNGSTTRTTSTAPIGSGKSQRIVIGGSGQHNTDSSGVRLNFPSGGTHPNGTMIITQINHAPISQLPSGYNNLGYYWIVNNYGANQSFSAINSIRFKPPRMPQSGFTNTNQVFFYKREDNDHLTTNWMQMCNPSSIASGTFTFDNTCNMTSFSQLHILENTVLPVELKIFEVSKTENRQARLNWLTATQENFSHFELEHSTNGVNFERFKMVYTDAPNSLEAQYYQDFHENPVLGYNFYRLKMVDLDGSFKYSDIKAISIEAPQTNTAPVIFPNPIVKGQSLTVEVDKLTNAHILIYKANGKLARDFLLKNGQNTIVINDLVAGTYFYSIQSQEKIYNGKVVIIK